MSLIDKCQQTKKKHSRSKNLTKLIYVNVVTIEIVSSLGNEYPTSLVFGTETVSLLQTLCHGISFDFLCTRTPLPSNDS